MLGVPGASDYEQIIHQLLSAWRDAKKPVLLIASDHPGATREAVESWQGWELLAVRLQHPVETVRKAVRVNEEHLIAQSGEKVRWSPLHPWSPTTPRIPSPVSWTNIPPSSPRREGEQSGLPSASGCFKKGK
jgi:hypothetical protein